MGGFFWLNNYIYNQKQGNVGFQSSYKDATYIIEGKSVILVNGYSEVEVTPGSSSKIITKYFGNEAEGDLNMDGISDIAFLLTQDSGGSGTFYYAVASIKTDSGYQGTNAFFLGDRISPQTTEIDNGIVTVNYAIREPGFPMTAIPSVGVSKYLKIENGVLTEKSVMPTFGMSQKMLINTPVQFTDGLTIVLKEINDSHCKPGMVCVWAGELSPLLNITGGGLGNMQKEVRLGTTTAKIIVESGYEFNLIGATETTATIIVTKELKTLGKCYIGGCGGEICSDRQDIASICIYKEEFACYKTAKCERQAGNQCGWTQTPELKTCLDSSK